MANKKQSREYQRKRQEQRELMMAARTRQQRRTTWAVIAGSAVMIGLFIGFAVLASQPGSTPSASGPASDPSETPLSQPVPNPTIAADRAWEMVLDTNQGPITVSLNGAAAPQAVSTLVHLSRTGFFDQTDCHRLTTEGIYVLQCGDPQGNGTGGPGYAYGPIENAPADDLYPAGTVAMARQSNNANSQGSQFFIVYEDSTIPSDQAGGYTVVGTVTDGLSIVEGVASAGTIIGDSDGRPAMSVIINEVTIE